MAKIKVEDQSIEVSKSDSGVYSIDGKEVKADLIQRSKSLYHLILNDHSYKIEILEKDSLNGNLKIRVNNRIFETHHTFKLEDLLKSMGMEAGKKKLQDIKAPMPGLVLEVLISEGQEVKEGDDLIILEAMKMENALKAPQDGIIGSIAVDQQDKVDKNQVLLSYQ